MARWIRPISRLIGYSICTTALLLIADGDSAAESGVSLVTLLQQSGQADNRAQHIAVDRIVRDYAHYAPHIDTLIAKDALTSHQEFVLTLAIRTRLKQARNRQPSPELENWLLYKAATAGNAVRFNAQAILRVHPTARTIDRFLAVKTRVRRHADQTPVRTGQDIRRHYALTGADVFYDFAARTIADIRYTPRGDGQARQQQLDTALRALSVAWAEHAGVAPQYKIEFVKALYGKALVWIAAADQIARNRLPHPVALGGADHLSAAGALAKASALFREFDRETRPVSWRNWYLHPHQFRVVQACEPGKFAPVPEGIRLLRGCIAARSP